MSIPLAPDTTTATAYAEQQHHDGQSTHERDFINGDGDAEMTATMTSGPGETASECAAADPNPERTSPTSDPAGVVDTDRRHGEAGDEGLEARATMTDEDDGAGAAGGPIILDDPFPLTHEESVLFSALEAAADFHFSRHPTADYTSSSSSSSASSGSSGSTDDRGGSSRSASGADISKLASGGGGLDDDIPLPPPPDEPTKIARAIRAASVSELNVPPPGATDPDADESGAPSSSSPPELPRRDVLNIRVAGGWVRDKLLHLGSDDIDVALDDASGVQFAHMVRNYLEYVEDFAREQERSARKGEKPMLGVHHRHHHHHHHHHHHKYKIGVIAANPDQSKHLETATMRVFGLGIDFVNLRSEEEYLPHSRIPVATNRFGTPLEDALRRDFTVNSLFYNVRTRNVEDYTGRGLTDLRRKLIETPIDPAVTLRDDPLRVLRAVRFSVRFKFDLANDLRAAARSKEVHRSLVVKVSRERVGAELEGMLTGKAADPPRALELLWELGLGDAVFLMSTDGGDGGVGDVRGEVALHRGLGDGGGDESSPSRRYEDCVDAAEREILRSRGWDESHEILRLVVETLIPRYEAWTKRLTRRKGGVGETKGGGGDGNAATSAETTTEEAAAATKGDGEDRNDEGGNDENVAMRTRLDERLFFLSSYLLPFRDLTFPDPKKRPNVRHRVVTDDMMREGIKFKNKDVTDVGCMLDHLDGFRSAISAAEDDDATAAGGGGGHIVFQRWDNAKREAVTVDAGGGDGDGLSRLGVGLLLREVRHLWVTCLLLATACELRRAAAEAADGDGESAGGDEGDVRATSTSEERILDACERFYTYVSEQNLDECWKVRPLLNGRAIIKALGMQKGGPMVGEFIEDQWRWMIANPDGTKEEYEVHLRERKRERDEGVGGAPTMCRGERAKQNKKQGR